ncbi:transmembrane protein 116 [Amia ocellicauda]|uniref:transmembrane protein 116 n=1 Tax=Amia ocellicauda TaxID=2972642 RepID=UPI0034649272
MTAQEPAPLSNSTLSYTQIQVLAEVYISSLSLSLIGSGSVIVVSLIKKRCVDDQVRPLFQLALADFLAAAVLLSTSVINILPGETLFLSYKFCEYSIPLAYCFYSISFLLVMVYSYEAKEAVSGWRESSEPDEQSHSNLRSRKETLYLLYFLAWAIPGLFMVTVVIPLRNSPAAIIPVQGWTDLKRESVASDNAFYCTSCILLMQKSDICHSPVWYEDLENALFFLYVLGVLTCCTVVYCKVKKWYHRQQEECLFLVEGDGFSRRHLRGMYCTARSIVLVVFICWTPAFVLVILSFNMSQKRLFALYVIQALTMSLQGFFNSIVYGWLRRNFRDVALGESVGLLTQNRRAFYDESLTIT